MTRRHARAAGALVTVAASMLLATACPPPPPPGPAVDLLTLGGSATVGDGQVTEATLSSDGRWVAFATTSTNVLAPDPGPGTFLRDTVRGSVERISADPGTQLGVSDDGRWVTWESPGEFFGHEVNAHDTVTDTTYTTDSQYGTSVVPVVDDGARTEVVYGISSPGAQTCWTWDLSSGTSQQCPTTGPDPALDSPPVISSNGRFVLQRSQLGGGVITLWDRVGGTTSQLTGVPVVPAALSDDGNTLTGIVAGPGGPEPARYDISAGTVDQPPAPLLDSQLIGVSANGRFLEFADHTGSAWSVRIWDGGTGGTSTLGSVGGLTSHAPLCGDPQGNVTDLGKGCLRTADALAAFDTNGLPDAYLVG